MNQIKITDTKAGLPVGTVLQPSRKDTTFYYFDSAYPVKDGTKSTYQIKISHTEEVLSDTPDLNMHRKEIDTLTQRIGDAEGTIKTQGIELNAQSLSIKALELLTETQAQAIASMESRLTQLETVKGE